MSKELSFLVPSLKFPHFSRASINNAVPKARSHHRMAPKGDELPISDPNPDQIRKICRGNVIPIWSFLLGRVRSDETAATVRRNIVIHGAKGTRRSSEEARERDAAEEEAERMRVSVRRMRRDVRGKMAELAREEGGRKRNVDDRANARMANYCLEVAAEQDKVVTERWLPELRGAVVDAQECLEDCQRVVVWLMNGGSNLRRRRLWIGSLLMVKMLVHGSIM